MGLLDRKAPRAMSDQRAIIDIGSNTVRLVIYGDPRRAPTVLLNEKVTARLGRGLSETGMLSDKAMATALAALGRYAKLLKLKGVNDVQCVATAATRDAGNGPEFLDAVRALGLKPRLLSGEEEAAASALGVIGAFPGAKGVVADLGGGSLELIHIDGKTSDHGTSLPFGTLRLPALREDGTARFARRIRKALDVAEWHCAPGEAIYLVGGSHRALARFAMVQQGWPIDDPHGFELSPELALKVCRSAMLGHPPPIPDISASRIASLPDAGALLSQLVRELRPAKLVFSSWGLREGLMFNDLEPSARALDPLVAGISAFTEALACPPALSCKLADWTQAVDASGRDNLRLSAIMLALASQRIEPNLRPGLIVDWALRKRWIGLGAVDRALLAACGLANSGRPILAEPLISFAPAVEVEQAIVWGLALRLARRFSALSDKALAGSRLAVDGDALVLSVEDAYTVLFSDAVDKDLRNLADRMGLRPELRRT
jgi:exopolyphosphatase/guanosine-5'-triphosphate,3'-diphosphate pyrophosphatase